MTEIPDIVTLTADIVSAYVSNNAVSAAELSNVIGQVHQALVQSAEGPKAPEVAPPTPAVPIRRSVTPDYLVSLEDGKRYKSLRRHLTTRGMTPDEYRAKWGLAKDYPMVAANYSARRSQLAKSLGLGRVDRAGGGEPAPAAPQPAASAEATPNPPARRRRKAEEG